PFRADLRHAAGTGVATQDAERRGDLDRRPERLDRPASHVLVRVNQRRTVTDRLDHGQSVLVEDGADPPALRVGRGEGIVVVEAGEDAAEAQLARAGRHRRGKLVDVMGKQVSGYGEAHRASGAYRAT